MRARLERIVLDPKSKNSDVIAASVVLADRSWGRPLNSHELNVRAGQDEQEVDSVELLAQLNDDELAVLLAAHSRLDAKHARGELPMGAQPVGVTDDDAQVDDSARPERAR